MAGQRGASRSGRGALTVQGEGWLIAATLIAAPAVGQPSPPPPDDAPVIAASCGAPRTVQPFEQVAATVAPLAPATLPLAGRLRWRWGLRIVTGDARVADLAGMEFSGPYGLLAVTRGGQWLSFDLQRGTLADVHAVGVATMRGATGTPTSLVTPYDGRTYVAFGGAHPLVVRYALGACGAASTAVPWIDVAGAAEPVIVQAAYAYLGIVGRRPGKGSALVLPYSHASVTLAGPDPLAISDGALVAASNPARIAPEIVIARQAVGGRTLVVLQSVEAWDDVRGGPPRLAVPLATLARTPSTMASYHSSAQKTTHLILAFPGPRPGTLDLYAFDDVGAL